MPNSEQENFGLDTRLSIDLPSFLRETPYIPSKLSTVIKDLSSAGVRFSEEDAILALQVVSNNLQNGSDSIDLPLERSTEEVDAVWEAFPRNLRSIPSIQYHFLQYTSSCMLSLVIIEDWFVQAQEARRQGVSVSQYFPMLKTDFVSSLILEASTLLKNSFEFSVYLASLFVQSRTEDASMSTNIDEILLQIPIPNGLLSSLFLNVSSGRELKMLVGIMDAQLAMSSEATEPSVLNYVVLDERLLEALLFGCSRAKDYEHRLDVAQSYVRRFKDECMQTLETGEALSTPTIAYETLMYIAADMGDIDAHKQIRIEASEILGPVKVSSELPRLSGKSGSAQSDSVVQKRSTIDHSTHVIALARAGYLADALQTLHVMHENRIALPLCVFQTLIEVIGKSQRTKSAILKASGKLRHGARANSREMLSSYTHMPFQYHNGFQMIQEVLKSMKNYGMNLGEASSFNDYEMHLRESSRCLPKGSYFRTIEYIIEAYTHLGAHQAVPLQPYFIKNTAQMSVDALCQLSFHLDVQHILQSHDVFVSALLLFLLRGHPLKSAMIQPDKSRGNHRLQTLHFPLHEEKWLGDLTSQVFVALWNQKLDSDRILEGNIDSKKIQRFRNFMTTMLPKGFPVPAESITDKIFQIASPVVICPLSFGGADEPSTALRSMESVFEFFSGAALAKKTLIIPFSTAVYLYHTIQAKEDEFGHEFVSFEEFDQAFRSAGKKIQSSIWYVTLKEELMIRSYSLRRKSAIDFDADKMSKADVLDRCAVHFIDGLSSLLRAFAGNKPVRTSIYTGTPHESKTMFLEQNLPEALQLINIV